MLLSLVPTGTLQTLLERQRGAQPLSRDAAKLIIYKCCPPVFQTGMTYPVSVNLTANVTVNSYLELS